MSRERLYDRVAEETASVIIRRYSTSFALASRLLGPGVRQHVENIYALVRIADEIVDGEAAGAGADRLAIARVLTEFERETTGAMLLGYSANLVVHAFALTARVNIEIPIEGELFGNNGIDAKNASAFEVAFQSLENDDVGRDE